MLVVSCPGDAADLYALIRTDLERTLRQREPAEQLALWAVRHAALAPSRAVVLGPAEIEVGPVVERIAAVLGVPHVAIPLGMAAGHGWQGTGIHEWLHDRASERFADRALVTLTDLDALLVPRGRYDQLSASSTRAIDDLARVVAQLLACEPIPSDLTKGPAIPTSGMSVALSGQAEGFTGEGSPGAWTDLGMSPQVARQLAGTPLVRLRELTGDDQVLSLLDGLAAQYRTYRLLGYRLDVDPVALSYAAAALSRGDYGGRSAAIGWLRRAADAGLVRLLEAGAPAGSLHVVTPDELVIPDPPKGRWTD